MDLGEKIGEEEVAKLSGPTRYYLFNASKILKTSIKDIRFRAHLSESDNRKIHLERYPSGRPYIKREEMERLIELGDQTVEVGDNASGGEGGIVGRVEKIVYCHEVPDLNWCSECKKDKNLRRRYVISGKDYCRKVVHKINHILTKS